MCAELSDEDSMKLILNGRVIWENPPELGHFGIKLRKQLLEEQIIERIFERLPSAGLF